MVIILFFLHILEWVRRMNYVMGQSFHINCYDYTELEQAFMKKTYELSISYPFKWYEFIHNIIDNRKVTYFKDTTMIVSLLELELSQIKILFEVLKEYLKLKLIKKILYKREFIIVHFHSVKTKEIWEIKNLWCSVTSYFMLKENYPDAKVYIRGVLQDNESKELVDLIFVFHQTIYLIQSTIPLKKEYHGCTSIYLYYERSRFLSIPTDVKMLKFSFDVSCLLKNFDTILEFENAF